MSLWATPGRPMAVNLVLVPRKCSGGFPQELVLQRVLLVVRAEAILIVTVDPGSLPSSNADTFASAEVALDPGSTDVSSLLLLDISQASCMHPTSRQVQNVHTGLDLTVPQHQEVRGKMMSGHVEYQILVVTRLAVFKSAKHRPEDVVQFLVSKKYSEIEEFYQKLSNHYPAASLPPLPRKVLFVGESDIRERRAMFDEILRCVSKDAQLAGSPELLEFLGTRAAGAAGLATRDPSVLGDTASQPGDSDEAFDFFEQQDDVQPPTLNLSNKDVEKSLEEEEEEEALDPLGIIRSKKPKKRPEVAIRPKPSPRLTIFDEEVDPDAGLFSPGNKASPQRPLETTQDSLKLFDDPDLGGAVSLGDPLLLPTTSESGGPTWRDSSKELFRVEEDLDQILNLGSEPKPKPQTKPKPLVPAKPALPRKPTVPASVGPSETGPGPQKQQQIQAMDEMDILQYIQDHDTLTQTSPSLF